jgi:hypothetical protein
MVTFRLNSIGKSPTTTFDGGEGATDCHAPGGAGVDVPTLKLQLGVASTSVTTSVNVASPGSPNVKIESPIITPLVAFIRAEIESSFWLSGPFCKFTTELDEQMLQLSSFSERD